MKGDSVSAGTVVDVRVDGTLIASRAVSSDGSFSFTYTGSDSSAHTVTFRARNGDSHGSTVTVRDEPAGTVPTVLRHSGADRYATAADIALDSFRPGLSVVYVASGESAADALAGSALAGKEGAPVLLTRAGSLPSSTAAALRALAPGKIVILGGGSAVSTTVRTTLGAYAPTVTRISGADRYEVAAKVAATYPRGSTVYVANGSSHQEALVAAARAGATDSPLLLTGASSLPAATRTALDRLDPSTIVIVGRGSLVSTDVRTQLTAYSSQ